MFLVNETCISEVMAQDSRYDTGFRRRAFFICLFRSASALFAFFSISSNCFVSFASNASSFSISIFKRSMLFLVVDNCASKDRWDEFIIS